MFLVSSQELSAVSNAAIKSLLFHRLNTPFEFSESRSSSKEITVHELDKMISVVLSNQVITGLVQVLQILDDSREFTDKEEAFESKHLCKT